MNNINQNLDNPRSARKPMKDIDLFNSSHNVFDDDFEEFDIASGLYYDELSPKEKKKVKKEIKKFKKGY